MANISEDIRFQLSTQENILQSTRSTHYTLQGLFLAVAFALLITNITIITTSDFFVNVNCQKDCKSIYEFMEYMKINLNKMLVFGACGVLNFFGSILIWKGKIFNEDFSERILSRGMILDSVQHLMFLYINKKIHIFLKNTHKSDRRHVDLAATSLLKSIERIDIQKDNFDDVKEIFDNNKNIYNIMRYVKIYNDIYSYKYLENIQYIDFLMLNPTPRKISDIRTGHKSTFKSLWFLATSFSFLNWILYIIDVYILLNL